MSIRGCGSLSPGQILDKGWAKKPAVALPIISSESGLLWTRRNTFWMRVGDFLPLLFLLYDLPAPTPLLLFTPKLGFWTLLKGKRMNELI